MTDIASILSTELGPGLKRVEPLEKYTEIAVGGVADFFYEVTTSDELIRVYSVAARHRIPILLIGTGTSLVISEVGFRGLVIRNLAEGVQEIASDSSTRMTIEANSGTSIAKLVRFAIEKNYSGLEPFIGLKGSVGGAVYYNTKWIGSTLGDFVESVKILDDNFLKKDLTPRECQFEPQSSRFQRTNELIESVRFEVKRSIPDPINQRIRQAMAKQEGYPTQPQIIRIFNDVDRQDPTKFIEGVGMAGRREGGAWITAAHPNFIQNLGHATSDNILELVRECHQKVKNKYRLTLMPSFKYVGPDSFS